MRVSCFLLRAALLEFRCWAANQLLGKPQLSLAVLLTGTCKTSKPLSTLSCTLASSQYCVQLHNQTLQCVRYFSRCQQIKNIATIGKFAGKWDFILILLGGERGAIGLADKSRVQRCRY